MKRAERLLVAVPPSRRDQRREVLRRFAKRVTPGAFGKRKRLRCPFDPHPTTGGRNFAWKKLHAESMVEAQRCRREGRKPAPEFIYDENFRNVGLRVAT